MYLMELELVVIRSVHKTTKLYVKEHGGVYDLRFQLRRDRFALTIMQLQRQMCVVWIEHLWIKIEVVVQVPNLYVMEVMVEVVTLHHRLLVGHVELIQDVIMCVLVVSRGMEVVVFLLVRRQ